jgi:hypothetical protein
MPYPIAPLPLHLQRALTILIRLATFVENERKSYGVEDGSAFDLDDVESGSFWEEAKAWSVRRRVRWGRYGLCTLVANDGVCPAADGAAVTTSGETVPRRIRD